MKGLLSNLEIEGLDEGRAAVLDKWSTGGAGRVGIRRRTNSLRTDREWGGNGEPIAQINARSCGVRCCNAVTDICTLPTPKEIRNTIQNISFYCITNHCITCLRGYTGLQYCCKHL